MVLLSLSSSKIARINQELLGRTWNYLGSNVKDDEGILCGAVCEVVTDGSIDSGVTAGTPIVYQGYNRATHEQ